MLTSLSIRNVVLIEKLDLSFEKGLSVFTGETGAGKSILLDALSLCLGAKTDTGLIRYGAEQLSVTAEFDEDTLSSLLPFFKEQGIEVDSSLILRRIITKEGKSKVFINDQPVSLSLLRQIGEKCIEIHGQFASHTLLDSSTHIHVLDAYGKLQKEQNDCADAYRLWKEKKEAVLQKETILAMAKEEESYLKESLEDLEKLNPKKGEEEALSKQRTSLMNAEKITESLNVAYMILSSGSSPTIESMVHSVQKELEKASQLSGGSFDNILDRFNSISEELNETVELLESKSTSFEDPSSELEQIEDRYFALKNLERKHSCEVDDLPDLTISLRSQLDMLNKGENELDALRVEQEKMHLYFLKKAKALSLKRKTIAEKLDKAITEELPALKLSKAKFKTLINELLESDASPNGLDQVTFCVATHAVPFAPIHKIASGGELARFMLVLKVNLAQTESNGVMIFDEVDSGVGGATAFAVGERLLKLAKKCQVLVVTHSPQVASFGNHHFHVSKIDTQNGVVSTNVMLLDKANQIEEIARMLSGAHITPAARQAAQTLLDKS